MRVGSLFAGIGGFDLGLERAGMHTVWQVEKDPFRRAVLARHFPDAERFEDVRRIRSVRFYDEETGDEYDWVGDVDVLCGGFPCQDLSLAGLGAGIEGARSGLWSEFARIVGELRPRYVIVENVPTLLARGAGRVLGDLAACGYDAEWECLSAAAFGAPHIRDRLWLLAYPEGDGRRSRGPRGSTSSGPGQPESERPLPNLADTRRGRHRPPPATVFAGWAQPQLHGGWATEPRVDRVANGLPAQVDRVAAIGAALVPQIAEWIGARILSYEQAVKGRMKPDPETNQGERA